MVTKAGLYATNTSYIFQPEVAEQLPGKVSVRQDVGNEGVSEAEGCRCEFVCDVRV